MKKTRILIIGKTGQLGSELIKIFKNNRLLTPSINELDISKKDQTKKYVLDHQPQIIINTAAYLNLDKCEENPYIAFAINWLAVRDLVFVAKKINAFFIHLSTNYVFDGQKKTPYKEDDTPRPLQVYGMSKLAGEETVLKHYPENSMIIRTSVLFGGKGSPEKGNFILNRIKDSQKKHLMVDLKQRFSITYAKDLALAIKKIIDSRPNPGIYHIVNQGICTWFDLTQYVFKLIASDCKLQSEKQADTNDKIRRPLHTFLNTSKIKSMNIELPFWKKAVKRYLKEIRQIK